MFGELRKDKFYCPEDDWAAKGRYQMTCPYCRQPMKFMGTVWRPGKKGSRTRVWDERVPRHRQEAARLNSRGDRYRPRHWVSWSGTSAGWVRERIGD